MSLRTPTGPSRRRRSATVSAPPASPRRAGPARACRYSAATTTAVPGSTSAVSTESATGVEVRPAQQPGRLGDGGRFPAGVPAVLGDPRRGRRALRRVDHAPAFGVGDHRGQLRPAQRTQLGQVARQLGQLAAGALVARCADPGQRGGSTRRRPAAGRPEVLRRLPYRTILRGSDSPAVEKPYQATTQTRIRVQAPRCNGSRWLRLLGATERSSSSSGGPHRAHGTARVAMILQLWPVSPGRRREFPWNSREVGFALRPRKD